MDKMLNIMSSIERILDCGYVMPRVFAYANQEGTGLTIDIDCLRKFAARDHVTPVRLSWRENYLYLIRVYKFETHEDNQSKKKRI
jgi:hypothetical protein